MSKRAPTETLPEKKISRDDIEAKFRELRGDVDERVEQAKMPAVAIGVAVVVVTIIATYWLGKRRGKKRQMVLEIRRI